MNQDQQHKKHKKNAGFCPVCQKGLAKSKKELLDKLGIDTTIRQELSAVDIKNAFKEAAKKAHPDRGGDPNEFQEIKKAREELLEMLEEEGSIPSDPLSIKPLENIMNTKSPEELIKSIPDPIQLLHMRQAINNIKANWKPGTPCPYCKQH